MGRDLRAGRFYGEIISSRRPVVTVHSEIGTYRLPSAGLVSFFSDEEWDRFDAEHYYITRFTTRSDGLEVSSGLGKPNLASSWTVTR